MHRLSTLSALLVLGQGALLNGSWWVSRALGGERRRVTWFVWASLAASIVGALPEVTAALSGNAGLSNAAQAVGLVSATAMAVSQAGLGAVASGRAVRSARERSRLAAAAVALLARGDAALAGGRYDHARSAYQQEVSAAQGADELAAIRQGLARIAWLDYLSARFENARASAGLAAAGGDLDGSLGATTMLLAGCLALASGRLDLARPAIEDAIRLAEEAKDVSQAVLARVVLGCEHYLEGWGESGRQYLEAHAHQPMRIFDRQVAGALLVALSLAARERGRREDAAAIATAGLPLVPENSVLASLGEHARAPEASPHLERAAAELARLVRPAAAPVPAPLAQARV